MRAALFAVLVASAAAQIQPDPWVTDFAKAKAQAKAEHKDLLIAFVGVNWNHRSRDFETELFQQQQFLDEILKEFVFVKLDFMPDIDLIGINVRRVSAEEVAQNEKLRIEYGVEEVPAVFLADADARPYDLTVALTSSDRLKNFLERVAEGKYIRDAFAAAMVKADAMQGIDRAKALDAALSVFRSPLCEPMMHRHYAHLVNEIIRQDADGAAGLKRKYEEQQAKYGVHLLQREMNRYASLKEWGLVITLMDRVIAQKQSALLTQGALLYKGIATLEKTGDSAAAVELLESARALDPKSDLADDIARMAEKIRRTAQQQVSKPATKEHGNGQ